KGPDVPLARPIAENAPAPVFHSILPWKAFTALSRAADRVAHVSEALLLPMDTTRCTVPENPFRACACNVGVTSVLINTVVGGAVPALNEIATDCGELLAGWVFETSVPVTAAMASPATRITASNDTGIPATRFVLHFGVS